MKISQKSIEYLVGIVTGDSGISAYRSGPELVRFFNSFGEEDLYGQGFPSRHQYVRDKLTELNGTERLRKIAAEAFDFGWEMEEAAEDAAFQFNKILSRDGFKLVKKHHTGFMQGHEYIQGPLYFEVKKNTGLALAAPEILLSEASLREHSAKVARRIELGDYSGAIASCYTFLEEFAKLALKDEGVEFNENEGDLRKLFRLLFASRGMTVEAETPDPFKPILSGINSLVSGFYEIANKASDRHAAKLKPAQHHARFVASLTYSICEFLVHSRDHRRALNR
ncbi:abortive infection family protein [uncultured Aliiroseovarius sp.]|uniref:abortive infection family protein n=1 Tax=uncultured Aliiroseovarius sp. TaxID=1658783 RepID=UPI00261FDDB5|nr:abortive infection family protein [uncultured Aliiroseovarius sp.]